MRLTLAAALTATGLGAAEPLPELALNPDGLTVSGLSSGAYMAVQLQVAHSAEIDGAAVIAGGPWNCAEGAVWRALGRCMDGWWGAPDAEWLLELARIEAENGELDPLDGLTADRVWMFHGTEDETVGRPPMDALRAFYALAGVPDDHVAFIDGVPAGHAFIAEEAPVACGDTGPPFLNDCDFWMAGRLLGHLYPGLAAPGTADPARLFRFDQAEFLEDPEDHGMGPEGFVYIPEACESDPASCRLHVALAGCRQTVDHIGDTFPTTAGYNRWAETNSLVILYPQSHVIEPPWWNPVFGGNPKGCWDWWGYDDPDYATRDGRQIRAIAGMTGRLGVPLEE